MEIEVIRGLVIIAAIVVGTTGLLALSIGMRALLLLPLFGFAFALPPNTVILLADVFVGATATLVMYCCLSVYLRHRLTTPEFGRPSRRSRAVSLHALTIGSGTIVICGAYMLAI